MAWTKEEKATYMKEYRINNKEYLKQQREINKEKDKIVKQIYRKKNSAIIKKKEKEYRDIRKDTPEYKAARKQAKDKYNKNNKDKNNKYSREYYRLNKNKRNKNSVEYQKERRKIDPIFKFKERIRNMIKESFKRKFFVKNSNTKDILGCTIEEFKKHLIESAIMNYGFYDIKFNYEIDHIIPLETAKTEEEVGNLCHYLNLQFLTPKDNKSKGKIIGWETKFRRTKS